ncbi:MAG: hypothetical protein QOI62_2061 [Solirubrobacteraceae bacterium]|jgi:uncharacterized protein YggE|nr:hypothetical protein [Solirubrobacteraceae bacterium]MEA2394485.1 hypothetical protein [Solirubrobacteraceae bacterium]
MRRWIGVVLTTAAALAVAGVLGVAGAQTPATPAAGERLVTVNGGGEAQVSSDASASDRRTAYRTALGAALDDAAAKAAFVAQRAGLTLGAVQSVTEQTGSVLDGCVSFAAAAPGVAGEARPLRQVKRPRPRKRAGAKPAQATSGPFQCQVIASVTVGYGVSG